MGKNPGGLTGGGIVKKGWVDTRGEALTCVIKSLTWYRLERRGQRKLFYVVLVRFKWARFKL